MKKNMNKTTKNNFITYGMVIAIFVVVQILSSTGNLSRLLTGLLVPICVYIIASLSLNLVVGYSGELSLGHAGFMCVGAYSSALFSHVTSDVLPSVPRLILALLVGAAVAAVFGVLIGIPVLRLRGDYLAIVTLAFGEIIKNLINILYVGVDDKGLHVATSAANLKLDPGGKQIIKGALGVSGTATLYSIFFDSPENSVSSAILLPPISKTIFLLHLFFVSLILVLFLFYLIFPHSKCFSNV